MPDSQLPIEPPYEHWGAYFADYSPPPPVMLRKWMTSFVNVFRRICSELGLNSGNYHIDAEGLREALIRTDKRYLHYRMYYNGMRMDEKKRLAEVCYWVIRLNVISLKSGGSITESARMSSEVVKCFVESYCRRQGYTCRILDNETSDYLVYALSYRELSRETLVLLTEGLIAESTR